MTRTNASTISVVVGTVGVLFILAGAFGVLPMGYALFLGVAAFVVSGAIKKVVRVEP